MSGLRGASAGGAPPGAAMQPFSLLLKPASADCNLRCDYCFYLGKRALYPGVAKHRMRETTLAAVMRAYFATPQPVYSMVWQGGEPTLMGEGFFQRVVALQKQYAPPGARIANALQTNATLVTDGLAAHLARYRFLVGCSIDGPADLHDAYRRTRKGRPSHARVVRGLRTLQHHGAAVNAVALVSAANVGAPDRVYRHLLELGLRHVQFVPCVETDATGRPLPYSISGEQWGAFLLSVFETWLAAGHPVRVSVRNFDSLLARLSGAGEAECRLCARCDQYLVVEHNGDVYPCDFFVDDHHRLGNVREEGFAAMRTGARLEAFAAAKGAVPSACRECRHFELCMGDCPKFRTDGAGAAPSRLCAGWRLFLDGAGDRLRALAQSVRG